MSMSAGQVETARLRVGLIGAGRVGAPFAAALAAAGHVVVGIHAVSNASKDRAELLLPGVPILSADEVARTCDLLLLTPPDDALAELAHGLHTTGALQAGQILVHTAGRFGAGIFNDVLSSNILPLAIHPIMTFSGTSVDLKRMQGAFFGVTAPTQLLPIAQALVIEMGGEPITIAEEDRATYHLALAWSTNFITSIVAQGADLLKSIGIRESEALLHPLLDAAVDNVLRRGDQALTGPIARGDVGSVAAHIETIKREHPELLQPYRVLGRLTAERALASGMLTADSATSLLTLLGDAS